MAKKMKLSSRVVYDTTVVLGRQLRPLKFSNKMLAYAEIFCEHIGMERDASDILKRAATGKKAELAALLFGAAKAANEKYSVVQFERDFSIDSLDVYVQAICDGLEHFLPPSDTQSDGKDPNAEAPMERMRI